jgi:hypothetical protein
MNSQLSGHIEGHSMVFRNKFKTKHKDLDLEFRVLFVDTMCLERRSLKYCALWLTKHNYEHQNSTSQERTDQGQDRFNKL